MARRIDRILSGFDKTIRQLDSLIKKNKSEEDFKASVIERMEADMAELRSESEEATMVKENIERMLGRVGEAA